MNPLPPLWVGLSALAFGLASLWLSVSLYVFVQVLRRLGLLMDDLRGNVKEVGDLATHTVTRASLTMDMVEQRVGQAMAQANTGAAEATRQSVGVGTILTGIYIASRVVGMVRGNRKPQKRAKRRR